MKHLKKHRNMDNKNGLPVMPLKEPHKSGVWWPGND